MNEVIKGTDLQLSLKEEYTNLLNAPKDGELCRIKDETVKAIGIQMRKLENNNDDDVIDLRSRLIALEKSVEEFEESWQRLISENKALLDRRLEIVENEIKKTIRESISNLSSEYKRQLDIDMEEIFKMTLDAELPLVTDNDIVQNKDNKLGTVKDSVYTKSYANSGLEETCKRRTLEFQKQRNT